MKVSGAAVRSTADIEHVLTEFAQEPNALQVVARDAVCSFHVSSAVLDPGHEICSAKAWRPHMNVVRHAKPKMTQPDVATYSHQVGHGA